MCEMRINFLGLLRKPLEVSKPIQIIAILCVSYSFPSNPWMHGRQSGSSYLGSWRCPERSGGRSREVALGSQEGLRHASYSLFNPWIE